MGTYCQDSFADTAGTVLTAHTGEVGATWTAGGGSPGAVIPVITAANRLRGGNAGTTWWGYASGTPGSADQDATWDTVILTTGLSDNVGVALRMATAANTMYVGRYKQNVIPNTWEITKVVAGVGTSLGHFDETLGPGTYTTEFSVVGSTLNLYGQGVLKVGPVTDSDISSAGHVGVRITGGLDDSSGMHMDNLQITDYVGPRVMHPPGGSGRSGGG